MENTIVSLMAPLLILGATVGQTPCFTNLVQNGDFEAIIPTWSQTAGSASLTFPAMNVDAVTFSRCALMGGDTCTLRAPAQVAVTNQRYLLTFDVFAPSVFSGWSCDVDLVANGTPTRIGRAIGSTGHIRATIQFTPVAGSYELLMGFANPRISGVGGSLYVDNVVITPSPELLFNITSDRATNANCSYTISGRQNGVAVVMIAAAAASPFPIPGCIGQWSIGPLPNVYMMFGPITMPTGSTSGNVVAPPSVSGVYLHWQPILIDSPCEIGCATKLGFL